MDGFVALGPTFVKLGQLISSTKGLVPDWIADAFAGCRDAVPPAPIARVTHVLERGDRAGRPLPAWPSSGWGLPSRTGRPVRW